MSNADVLEAMITPGGDRARDLMRRGRVFDVAYMALKAAIEGQGVALDYALYVESDVIAGRLVTPFTLSLPSTVGFDAYLVCPESTVQVLEVRAFREWLLAEAGAPPQRYHQRDRPAQSMTC